MKLRNPRQKKVANLSAKVPPRSTVNVPQSTSDFRPRNSARLPRQPLVLEPVRLIGGDAQTLLPLLLVGLKVPFAPVDVAFALEGQDVRSDAVEEPAVVADDHDATGVIENRLF